MIENMLDCIKIIESFYDRETSLCDMIVDHGTRVAQKAIKIADRLPCLKPDRDFIYESAMLHDIGIGHTNSPGLGINGHFPYIAHGILGRVMMEKLNLYRHALVCERHIGVGLTVQDIQDQKLPLPLRDMVPISLEEKIVCYADKFFSKSPHQRNEKKPAKILEQLKWFGRDKPERFLSWMDEFGV